MGFQRVSFEQIVGNMVNWSRGVVDKITDYRVGSRIRTLYESVAIVLEQFYDSAYTSTKALIESNLYAVLGFDKLPAISATGYVTFSSNVNATNSVLIPAGTIVKTLATSTTAPISFQTTQDVIIATGSNSVTAPVVCLTAGSIGNVSANSVVDFSSKPSGVDVVKNANAFTNGVDQETSDAQKYRFNQFISALMRGTKEAIVYGALTSQVTDANGNVTERVTQAVLTEDLVNNLGIVNLYIWNGVNSANTVSTNLINQTQTTIYGSYDSNGKPIYGYKPAGIKVNVSSATPVSLYLKVQTSFDPTVTDYPTIQKLANTVINNYFSSLKIGQSFINSALEAKIKNIPNVDDVVLTASSDNVSFNGGNFTCNGTQILISTSTVYS